MFTHEGDEDRTDYIIQQWPGEHIPVLLTRAKIASNKQERATTQKNKKTKKDNS